MNHLIAHTRNLSPWDIGILFNDFPGQFFYCFTDYFKITDYCVLRTFVVVKKFLAICNVFFYPLDCVPYVEKKK